MAYCLSDNYSYLSAYGVNPRLKKTMHTAMRAGIKPAPTFRVFYDYPSCGRINEPRSSARAAKVKDNHAGEYQYSAHPKPPGHTFAEKN